MLLLLSAVSVYKWGQRSRYREGVSYGADELARLFQLTDRSEPQLRACQVLLIEANENGFCYDVDCLEVADGVHDYDGDQYIRLLFSKGGRGFDAKKGVEILMVRRAGAKQWTCDWIFFLNQSSKYTPQALSFLPAV